MDMVKILIVSLYPFCKPIADIDLRSIFTTTIKGESLSYPKSSVSRTIDASANSKILFLRFDCLSQYLKSVVRSLAVTSIAPNSRGLILVATTFPSLSIATLVLT